MTKSDNNQQRTKWLPTNRWKWNTGNTIGDNVNCFASYASTADSFKQVWFLWDNKVYQEPPKIPMHIVLIAVMKLHIEDQKTTVYKALDVHCCEPLQKTTFKTPLMLGHDEQRRGTSISANKEFGNVWGKRFTCGSYIRTL